MVSRPRQLRGAHGGPRLSVWEGAVRRRRWSTCHVPRPGGLASVAGRVYFRGCRAELMARQTHGSLWANVADR